MSNVLADAGSGDGAGRASDVNSVSTHESNNTDDAVLSTDGTRTLVPTLTHPSPVQTPTAFSERSPRFKNAPTSLSSPDTASVSTSPPDYDLNEDKLSPLTKSPLYEVEGPRRSPLTKSPSETRLRSESLSKRRRSAQLLPPLSIPNITYPHRTSSQMDVKGVLNDYETSSEGLALFGYFVYNELCKMGFDSAELYANLTTLSILTQTELSETLKLRLDNIVKKFRAVPQRHMISLRAKKIDLDTISQPLFDTIVEEIFSCDRVTVERILVFYFFCLDLGAKALELGNTNDFMNVMDWAATFVKDRAGRLVFKYGGWSRVLVDRAEQMKTLGIGVFSIFIIAGLCYWFSNGRSN